MDKNENNMTILCQVFFGWAEAILGRSTEMMGLLLRLKV